MKTAKRQAVSIELQHVSQDASTKWRLEIIFIYSSNEIHSA